MFTAGIQVNFLTYSKLQSLLHALLGITGQSGPFLHLLYPFVCNNYLFTWAIKQ